MLHRNKVNHLVLKHLQQETSMNAYPFDQWVELNRAAMAPVIRFQELAADAAQKMLRYNLSVTQDCVDFGSRQIQLLGELKDPQKWGLETGKAVSEFNQKLVDRAADYFKVTKETQEAFGQWADTTVKAATERFTPANA